MDAMILTILAVFIAIVSWVWATWFTTRALKAQAQREIAKMMRDPDELEEKAQFFREEARTLREKRGGR